MHIDRSTLPKRGTARTPTEVLGWASTPPEGAVLTVIQTSCRLTGRGYTIFVTLEWEVPPLPLRWVNRKISHEMTVTAHETWECRPSPADILRAVADTVMAISTCPVVEDPPWSQPLPGLDRESLRRRR